jgi:ABC-2 type transport system ATP-binding protein
MELALELENLSKTYRTGWRRIERKVVTDISLAIPSGKVFGLLGPNGAGKTTTIKIALGFLRPDSGRVSIFGRKNSAGLRERIGFLSEQPYFYPYLTAEQAMDFYGRLFGMKNAVRKERIAKLLELVGLSDASKLPLNKFSKGMMQRLGIAQALINNPDLLIVDEPASGLDPIGQVEIRTILKNLNNEGKSILISSHYLSELENVCHEVAIVNKGAVIMRGKIEDLLSSGNSYIVRASGLPDTWKPPTILKNVDKYKESVNMIIDKDDLDGIIDSVRSSAGHVEEVRNVTKSLEQLFLEMVKGDSVGGSVENDLVGAGVGGN